MPSIAIKNISGEYDNIDCVINYNCNNNIYTLSHLNPSKKTIWVSLNQKLEITNNMLFKVLEGEIECFIQKSE